MEHHHQPLAPRHIFLKRVVTCVLIAFLLIVTTIFIGAIFYHAIEGQTWLDAFLNSVMMMTGLGLQSGLTTDLGKVFTSVYALLSSIVFFFVLAILFAPLIHRFLHRFHLDMDNKK